jgi:hypothetical protein
MLRTAVALCAGQRATVSLPESGHEKCRGYPAKNGLIFSV